ncbi:MAG TPA: mannosyltransferase family protein [Pirellulales bacterium]|nr:mannosyltransferase family protein [Pirellulales bacterium]
MLKDLQAGFTYYYVTSLVVLLGALFGFSFVAPCKEAPTSGTGDFVDALFAWDGRWYRGIATEGYSFDAHERSNVAFYPAYPGVSAALSWISGLQLRYSLLLVSHGSLAAAFVLLVRYARLRFPEMSDEARDYIPVCFGLLPTTYFFRMGYSESLFVLLLLMAMWGIERRWRTVWIVFVVGAATACRAVGVALLAPLAMHLWETSRTRTAFTLRSAVWLPLACWGLAAWVAYQAVEFGEPWAFIQTQQHWSTRQTSLFSWDGIAALLSFRPIRSVYDPASPCYWGNFPPRDNPAFNLMFANPIYFLGTAALVVAGRAKGWLSNRETALSAALLLIPYVLQADRACMAAEARYASSVFPAYFVMGHLLARLPGALAGVLLGLSATFLAIYSALFVRWYWFY